MLEISESENRGRKLHTLNQRNFLDQLRSFCAEKSYELFLSQINLLSLAWMSLFNNQFGFFLCCVHTTIKTESK